METDVLIVGAGPSGLSLAAQFVRHRINFVILDKKEGVTDLSKALAVQARTLEIYDQLGIADQAVANGEKAQHLALLRRGELRARIDFGDFGERLSPFPFVLLFEQSKNERLLYDYLRQNGKDVRWKTELQSFSQNGDGVRAVLQSAAGENETIEARYLAGCDGPGSTTRHLLGIDFDGTTDPRLFYVADVELDFQAEPGTVQAAFLERSFVLMFPLKGGRQWRLVGNLPDYDTTQEPEVKYEQIEERVKTQIQRPLDITKVHWFSSYKVHTRHAK
jgi:2-polyprenyl-6-methoxyphenol hydroxylase-like FAD-dependent oxidoreductase